MNYGNWSSTQMQAGGVLTQKIIEDSFRHAMQNRFLGDTYRYKPQRIDYHNLNDIYTSKPILKKAIQIIQNNIYAPCSSFLAQRLYNAYITVIESNTRLADEDHDLLNEIINSSIKQLWHNLAPNTQPPKDYDLYDNFVPFYMTNSKAFHQAWKIVITNIEQDSNYRQSWEANIAMAFHDSTYNHTQVVDFELLHEISNGAAKEFIDNEIKVLKDVVEVNYG